MPTISRFYGIAIRMYVRRRIFNALQAEHEANVSIGTGEVIDGSLPNAAAPHVRDFAA
jgi:hypothetical protein